MIDEKTRLFITAHRHEDVRKLALQASRYADVNMANALSQIAGWQAAKQKIPSWAAIDDIVYPQHLSMEQCSSEHTAQYKADICQRLLADATHPTTLIDLTGGLGVDFAFMAKHFQRATYVEQQEYLCHIAQHNLPLLGIDHANVVCTDCTTALGDIHDADFIFIDPARRDQNGARTFAIADCTPDVLAIEDQLLEKAQWVMIKLSPMLDWHKTMDDLQRNHPNVVREIHIVAVGNECKELLFVLSAKPMGLNRTTPELKHSPTLYCHNDEQEFVCELGVQEFRSDRSNLSPLTSHLSPQEPLSPHETTYLYEPNAAIMKAGCFAELTLRWPVWQLAPNSHLFLSSERLPDFPGRAFQVTGMGTMNKRQLKTLAAGIEQANITVRNFPLSVAELRRRLKIKDGGDHYIFASTTEDNIHVLFVCRKILKNG
ncbi:MAG: SAM-dependent methyltransferase [Prevotella sp.]|nr:SAM-dependent methyltransferase [Prevotella sp.]